MAKRVTFVAIAPDGTEVTFASSSRTYTHAVLVRDPATGGWGLWGRCGRPDLVDPTIAAARKVYAEVVAVDAVVKGATGAKMSNDDRTSDRGVVKM